MKYKGLLVVALFLLSTLLSIPASCEEQEQSQVFDWENIYQAESTPSGQRTTLPDLTVYLIERRHISLYNDWEVRYKLYSTKNFFGTFRDKVTIDDDSSEWTVDYIYHSNEAFYEGQTPYYTTDTFAVPGIGWYDVNVYADQNQQVSENNEQNNHDDVCKYFLYIP